MNISGWFWFILSGATDVGQRGQTTRWQVIRKQSANTWCIQKNRPITSFQGNGEKRSL